MSTEAKIDTCYIDVLRRRKLSHAEKRGKYFDALWALSQDEYDGDQRAMANYHKGHEEAIALIIEELIAPDDKAKSDGNR